MFVSMILRLIFYSYFDRVLSGFYVYRIFLRMSLTSLHFFPGLSFVVFFSFSLSFSPGEDMHLPTTNTTKFRKERALEGTSQQLMILHNNNDSDAKCAGLGEYYVESKFPTPFPALSMQQKAVT